MKRYHDIAGDGGSRVLEQVAEQRARIADGLAGVRHLVAVGSGKGGVGKSTLTLHLAGAMRARGLRVAILDADFNGPSQARMAGVQDAVFVPGSTKVALPRTRNGIGVFSMGSLIPETAALEFESAARGESHTWRATREFALLGEIIGSFEWGALDVLLFDLPPGADRTVQYADFLGARTSFLLVTIPSEVARGVVARSVAALAKGPNRLLGYVENMSGYFCRDCNSIRPLFSDWGALPRQTRLHASASAEATADLAGAGHEPSLCDREGGRSRGPLEPRSARVAHSPSLVRSDSEASGAPEPSELGIPCLGTIPFDPELARHCDLGLPVAGLDDTPTGRALEQITERLLDALDPARKSDR